MKRRQPLLPRKQPRQERSRQMREDILQATLRVLQQEGPLKLTTERVADAAGISVGSLYQYFPNKQALIYALHTRTIEAAWLEVQRVLDHPRWSARQKIERVAGYFFRTESEDVSRMGLLLGELEGDFEAQPEHRALEEKVARRFRRFVKEARPRGDAGFDSELLITVLESVGRSVAARGLGRAALDRRARACAKMLADYLSL